MRTPDGSYTMRTYDSGRVHIGHTEDDGTFMLLAEADNKTDAWALLDIEIGDQ